MKRALVILFSLIILVCLTVGAAVPVSADGGTKINEQGLYIKTGPIGAPGWQTQVGVVQVYQNGTNNETNYTIRYVTSPGWYLFETHFDYGDSSFNGIPCTKNSNNPIPGKFDWGDEYYGNPQTAVEYNIGMLSPGSYVFVAHAVVGQKVGCKYTNIQTAWGDCNIFPSKKWAKYWTITIPVD